MDWAGLSRRNAVSGCSEGMQGEERAYIVEDEEDLALLRGGSGQRTGLNGRGAGREEGGAGEPRDRASKDHVEKRMSGVMKG